MAKYYVEAAGKGLYAIRSEFQAVKGGPWEINETVCAEADLKHVMPMVVEDVRSRRKAVMDALYPSGKRTFEEDA